MKKKSTDGEYFNFKSFVKEIIYKMSSNTETEVFLAVRMSSGGNLLFEKTTGPNKYIAVKCVVGVGQRGCWFLG